MNRKLEKAFTLIELLAVIIILAIVALISTPIILNVVDEARESANKSSVAMYADAVKLAVIDNYFENQSYPAVNNTWIENNVEYGGERIVCQESYYTETEGVTLHECTIGDTAFNYVDDMSVSAEDTVYCYTKGKVYTDCDDLTYRASYGIAQANSSSTTGYADASGANQPKLFDNMVAVKYDDINEEWLVADTNEKWYDYAAKEWANAVVLNENAIEGDATSHSREYYLNNIGTEINMDDISQMYVWIPRYRYTIFNGNNGSAPEQEITINFETGIETKGTVTCVDNVSGNGTTSENCIDTTNGSITDGTSTYTHPAFTFGDTELTGFWVGKFENSAPSSTSNFVQLVSIKPNVHSWRAAKVSTFYESIKNISTEHSINADSHMMKNMEWGAVTYLSYSKYGRCEDNVCIEISKNDSSNYYTGRSLGKPSTVSGELSNYGTYTYETAGGQLASTTGNIYGIYDMSGGAGEYVMGMVVTSSNVPEVGDDSTYNSGFTGELSNHTIYTGVDFPESKYYDAYTYNTSNSDHSKEKLGDATKETLTNYDSNLGGWYSDYAYSPFTRASWFSRGGDYSYSYGAGLFCTSNKNGINDSRVASRSVITDY